jgi:hypothetical protein
MIRGLAVIRGITLDIPIPQYCVPLYDIIKHQLKSFYILKTIELRLTLILSPQLNLLFLVLSPIKYISIYTFSSSFHVLSRWPANLIDMST